MSFRHLLTALTRSLAAVVVLVALGASPVHAVDMTSPGAQCVVASYSASKSPYNFPSVAGAGSLGNASSTDWLEVVCPVISEPYAAPIRSGVIALINQYPGTSFTAFSCTLASVNIPSAGTYTGWFYPQGTSTASPNQQWLSFGSLPGNDHAFYICGIPPTYHGQMSSINAYRVIQ